MVEGPTFEKVKAAIFNLNNDSASGTNGYSREFFQHYWDIIEEDVFIVSMPFFCGMNFLDI